MKTILQLQLNRALRLRATFLVALAALPFVAPTVRAAVTEAWVQRQDNESTDSATTLLPVVRDVAGDIIVTGFTARNGSFLTIKYSGKDGSVLWRQQCGLANKYNFASAIAADQSGNVVVIAGASDPSFFGEDYYTAKYAAVDGALLWERRYNGPGNGNDYPSRVALDDSGNVIVTGTSTGVGGNEDYYTAKYAAGDGAPLWEQRYNGPADAWDQAASLAVDGAGNVIVTGNSWNGNNNDFLTLKYAAGDGSVLWERRYNGPMNRDDYVNDVAVDSSGNVFVTGVRYAIDVTSGSGDCYTAKYAAADGALLWEQSYNGPGNNDDGGYAVKVDSNGDVIVMGSSYSPGRSSDFCTIKYAGADGALLWERLYDGPTHGSDIPTALAVDGAGNAVVTGYSESDFYTAKYAAADGALLWEVGYGGPANSWDGASALALGPGTVAVTGHSGLTSQGEGNYVTVVYSDSLPPVITCPANIVAISAASGGALVNFTVTATDDSGVAPTITCVPPSGSVFPLGQTTVTCTATDGDGLSSTCSFTVTVLSRGEAVEQIVLLLEETSLELKTKRPLVATLEAACASFNRGNCISGVNQLGAFQNKVRSQIAKENPAIAQLLIQAAQAVIDACRPSDRRQSH
jgi:hypothetical protein